MMSTAKKFELAPDEVYIQQALKDGRARLVNDLSMKALGKPDVAFQARDIDTPNGLNMDHVHRLSLIHDVEGRLSPVVVFRATEGKKQRLILVDGFHRHEVYLRKKIPAIRAYVIDVPIDQIEHEARLFASMCNQITLLSRTDADKRKSVEMLLANPECLQWSPPRIANHCGVSPNSVQNWRNEYLARNQIPAPSHVITASGQKKPAKNSKSTGMPSISKRCNRPGFKTEIRGQYIYGRTEAEVTAKVDTIKVDAITKRSLLKSSLLRDYLNRHELFAECCHLHFRDGGSFSGVKTTGTIIVGVAETEADAIFKAIGILRLLPHHTGQVDPRRIVACYTEDYPAALLDLARKDGIEFLTPEELVASLKTEAE
jgi:transposase-like protein